MKSSVGSRILMWPTVIRLWSVVGIDMQLNIHCFACIVLANGQWCPMVGLPSVMTPCISRRVLATYGCSHMSEMVCQVVCLFMLWGLIRCWILSSFLLLRVMYKNDG